MTETENHELEGADVLPGLAVEQPRELAASLLHWAWGMEYFLEGTPQPGFDPTDWEAAADAVKALVPELERRGFLRVPVVDPHVDPVRFFRDWARYLEKVLSHVWDGEPMDVETYIGSMMETH